MNTRNNSTNVEKLVSPVKLTLRIENNGQVESYNHETKETKTIEKDDFSKLKLKFLFIAELFFWKGWHNRSERFIETSSYQYGSQEIKIFARNSKESQEYKQGKKFEMLWSGKKNDKGFEEKVDQYSLRNQVRILCTDSEGRLVRIELSPSGRAAYFQFKESLEDVRKTPDFFIDGFNIRKSNDEQYKDSFTPNFVSYPKPTEEELKINQVNDTLIADYYKAIEERKKQSPNGVPETAPSSTEGTKAEKPVEAPTVDKPNDDLPF